MENRIFLGVDAGQQKHVLAALNEGGEVVWRKEVPNDHGGCGIVVEQVKTWQEEGLEVWVGAEGDGGYLSPLDVRLCAAGCNYVNLGTVQARRFREMTNRQPDKDDQKDAEMLAEFLHWGMKRKALECWKPANEYFRTLKQISRTFTTIIESKVATQNHLVSIVREYWPELVITGDYFSTTDSIGLLSLLTTYPTPDSVVKAGKTKVAKVLTKASRRDQTKLAARLVEDARSLVKEVSVRTAKAEVVKPVAQLLLGMLETVRRIEKELEKLLLEHPFGVWMLKQKGIGVRTAASFMGEAGDLSQYANDSKLSRYAGGGPIKSQSGQAKERYWDGHRYNHHLKRALLLMCNSRAIHHAPSAAYVRCRKEKGDNHWQAVKKLARYHVRFLLENWGEVVNNLADKNQEPSKKGGKTLD